MYAKEAPSYYLDGKELNLAAESIKVEPRENENGFVSSRRDATKRFENVIGSMVSIQPRYLLHAKSKKMKR